MPAHLLNFFIFSGALILSWVVGAVVPPTWTVSQTPTLSQQILLRTYAPRWSSLRR